MSTHEQHKAAVRDCFVQAAAGNFDALPVMSLLAQIGQLPEPSAA